MARHASLADQYRAHREAFLLALELGCTPKEAERELRRRAHVRRAACGRIAAEQSETIPFVEQPAADQFADWSAPWMMRD